MNAAVWVLLAVHHLFIYLFFGIFVHLTAPVACLLPVCSLCRWLSCGRRCFCPWGRDTPTERHDVHPNPGEGSGATSILSKGTVGLLRRWGGEAEGAGHGTLELHRHSRLATNIHLERIVEEGKTTGRKVCSKPSQSQRNFEKVMEHLTPISANDFILKLPESFR